MVPAPASRWAVIRQFMSAALRPGNHASAWLWPYAVRVGLAAQIAGAAAGLLGIGHAYWAAVSAVSVLQASSISRSVPRMLQRVSGTIAGVLLGLGVLYADPPIWVIVVFLAALQCCAELTVIINYSFGLTFATPVALLVSSMGSATDPSTLASNRLWGTLLGAAVAVAIACLSPNRAWLSRVQHALTRVRRLSAEVPLRPGRLRSALIELHEAHELASGEMSDAKLPTAELLDVSHRAYRLLDGLPQETR